MRCIEGTGLIRRLLRLGLPLVLAAACGQGDREAGRPGPPASAGGQIAAGGAPEAGVDAGGTGGSTGAGGGPDAEGGVPIVPEVGVCDGFARRVLRLRGWPGDGLQLVLGPPATGGSVQPDAGPGTIALERADGSIVAIVESPVVEPHGITAVVIVPSVDPALHADRIEAARALVLSLPDGERVGVWKGQGTLPLVAELTERRAHVLARIEALPAESGAAIDAAAWTALGSRLSAVMGPTGPLGRSVVVVGESTAALSPPPPPTLRLGLAATPARSDDAATGALHVTWGPALLPAAAARTLVEAASRSRASAVRIGACGPFASGEVLHVSVGEASCELTYPGGPSHLPQASCDAAASARDDYPFPAVVELQMTTAERATHDALAAAEDESDFPVRVVLGQGEPIAAMAHFRGQTSLECARKNYSVNLDGGEARRLMPGAASDEFHLISLCKETHYFRQVLMARVMSSIGLFPLAHRYVRLRLGAEERGVYMLIEKPKDALLEDQVALEAMIRRRLDPDPVKVPEAVFPDPVGDPAGAERALDIYNALTAPIDTVAQGELYAALSERLDLDGYLRWMGLATYFQCGDYVDETFFYASPELGTPGGLYFRNHGWDMDDLFVSCHHQGRFAHVDPHGIVYCAEGHLDRALFTSPDVYARFVTSLEELMDVTFPPEVLTELLAGVRDELFAVLGEDAVCAGMTELVTLEPATASCAVMRESIQREMDAFLGRVGSRRNALRGSIDAWRAAP